MSLRMPLNYSDAIEMDGKLDDEVEEVMGERAAPGRGVEAPKRNPGQAENPSGTAGAGSPSAIPAA